MTQSYVNEVLCKLDVTLHQETLEVSLVGDWVLEAKTPCLNALLTQMQASSGIKQVVFSTQSLGRWDSLLMTDLIRLIDCGQRQALIVNTSTLPAGIQG